MARIDNRHGGNVHEAAKLLGVNVREIIDLSSNIAPPDRPMTQHLVSLYWEALHHLPEPFSETLIERLAQRYGHDPKHFIIGAGTTELFDHLCRHYRDKTALVLEPAYSDYRKYLAIHQLHPLVCRLSPEDNFQIPLDVFEAHLKYSDLVLLGNPNNPTGTLLNHSDLLRWVNTYPEILFIIDESYMPFVEKEETESLLSPTLLPNVIVLRSFSKIYALPGIRSGWMLCGNAELAETIKSQMSPWSLNSLGQKISEHLLTVDFSATKFLVHKNKGQFLEDLKTIEWIRPYSSDSNFILCRLQSYQASEVYEHCLRHNILIRDCSNFEELNSSFIRISIKNSEDMNALMVQFENFSL